MRWYRFLGYIVGFGLSRGSLFVVPLLLSNSLAIEVYGSLEFTQSIAATAALIAGLGLPASIPLVLLRDEVVERWDSLLVAILALSGLAMAYSLASASRAGLSFSGQVLIPLSIAVFILQGTWSTTLKARGCASVAVLLDAGFWIACLIGSIAGQLNGAPQSSMVAAIAVYASFLWVVTLRAYLPVRERITAADLLANVRIGLPLMAVTLLGLVVSSLGRLVTGFTCPESVVGEFAVLYRGTALPLVGHQLLMIAFYRQLFTWDVDTLKSRSVAIPLGVTSLIVLFSLASKSFGWLLGARFVEVSSNHALEGRLILAQTLLWSAIALNELLASRLQVSGRIVRVNAAYLVLGVIALYVAVANAAVDDPEAAIAAVTIGQSVLMAGYFFVQCVAINLAGHNMTRLWSSVTLCYAAIVFAIVAAEFAF